MLSSLIGVSLLQQEIRLNCHAGINEQGRDVLGDIHDVLELELMVLDDVYARVIETNYPARQDRADGVIAPAFIAPRKDAYGGVTRRCHCCSSAGCAADRLACYAVQH